MELKEVEGVQETRIYSSSVEIEDFIKGRVWRDFKGQIDFLIEGYRRQLEDPREDQEPRHFYSLGGAVRALRSVLEIPDIILEELNIRKGSKDGKR